MSGAPCADLHVANVSRYGVGCEGSGRDLTRVHSTRITPILLAPDIQVHPVGAGTDRSVRVSDRLALGEGHAPRSSGRDSKAVETVSPRDGGNVCGTRCT